MRIGWRPYDRPSSRRGASRHGADSDAGGMRSLGLTASVALPGQAVSARASVRVAVTRAPRPDPEQVVIALEKTGRGHVAQVAVRLVMGRESDRPAPIVRLPWVVRLNARDHRERPDTLKAFIENDCSGCHRLGWPIHLHRVPPQVVTSGVDRDEVTRLQDEECLLRLKLGACSGGARDASALAPLVDTVERRPRDDDRLATRAADRDRVVVPASQSLQKLETHPDRAISTDMADRRAARWALRLWEPD